MTQPHIALIGLSYRTAPIAVREQLSCSVADLPSTALAMGDRFGQIQGMVLLSTCNRVELYAALDGSMDGAEALLTTLLGEMTGVETAVLDTILRQLQQREIIAFELRAIGNINLVAFALARIFTQIVPRMLRQIMTNESPTRPVRRILVTTVNCQAVMKFDIARLNNDGNLICDFVLKFFRYRFLQVQLQII